MAEAGTERGAAGMVKTAAPAPPVAINQPRGRLFRKYAVTFAALIAGSLLVSGAIEVYFSYEENKQALVGIQREKAAGAAALVSQFITEIQAQVGWSLHSAFVPGQAGAAQRELDFIRLLRQVPAVTELSFVDSKGVQQLQVSRLTIDVKRDQIDVASEPKFLVARDSGLYISGVYFHKESEPHVTMALASAGRVPSVVVAEVNLKFIWDLVSQMEVGIAGRAYVIDSDDRLIAHPDISLVLRKLNLTDLPHVLAARTALATGTPDEFGPEISKDPEDRNVLTAHAAVVELGWLVFVDLPLSEALAPVVASLKRTGALVMLGIGLAVLIGLLLGRRMAVPIHLLREGAARFGDGDLQSRIEVHTGDELEALANEFNSMAGRLRESYSTLEQRVETRTQELRAALDRLRALAAVAEAVNSSLDLQTVLGTILSHACQLSDTGGGAIYVYDPDSGTFGLAAGHGMSEEMVATIRAHEVQLGETIIGRCAESRAAVQIADLEKEPHDPFHDVLIETWVRSLLAVPLLDQNQVIGALIVRRRSTGTFAQDTIDLLESFASQSALAVHNARLFREIEQKGEELKLASQHKSQFLANMSHELRTPLNAILGYTELVQDGVYGEPAEKIAEVLGRVQRNGKHLLALINDVLDLSKIESGEMTLSVGDFSFATLVQSVVMATESLATDKNLALTVDLPAELPPGRGDERRLSQVLLNLVGNAIKFTEAGEVGIAVGANNGAFHVQVTDTGPGIAAAEREEIFSEFRQIDSSSTKQKGGTGLGLAIAKRFVEMHEGRIWLDSEPGHGSTFHFTLPVGFQAEIGEP